MYLYLFWLVPATIFLVFFLSDRRRLVNAYLFSISLGLFLLFSALILVVRTELWFNQSSLLSLFFPYLLSLFYSVLFSQLFFFFLMAVK